MNCVLFTDHPTQDGHKIVEITLNAEQSLNALTLEMIDLIQPKLDSCKNDDAVAAIVINGSGEKAFCAGGDAVRLYHAMVDNSEPDFPVDFFTREYILDYTIHTYPKPIIGWGGGIVMGGGMGLLNGCSHRIVTETTMMAMPEVAIGLYPDVGGSWFLNKTPGRCGLFIGLTGSRINAADALFLGLADRFLAQAQQVKCIKALTQTTWQGDFHHVVNRVLRTLENDMQATQKPIESVVRMHFDLIQQLTDHDTTQGIIAALEALVTDDKWLQRAQKNAQKSSPLAMHMTYKQLQKTTHFSLKQIFESELALSIQCCRQREFPEGVRALLVDKDNAPDWTFKTVNDVDPSRLNALFVSPWATNPLASV